MTTKTVIVTGASSGIGLGIANAYLARGFQVVANGRSEAKLQEHFAGRPNVLWVSGDIGLKATAQQLLARALEAFGAVDILVNNAGIFTAKPFTEYSEEEFDALVSTNVKGFFYLSQMVARQMIQQQQGDIVNITASIALQPQASVPAAIPILLKGGLTQVTKALALEFAPHGIKVNAVSPGIIHTPLHSVDSLNFLQQLQPVGRIGEIADVVDAVLYLTDAKFTTGAILTVDGGMTAGRW
jgi:NAD(P)-dependent dehydrogenase (short-subunit alcohol dehydrogenase family)